MKYPVFLFCLAALSGCSLFSPGIQTKQFYVQRQWVQPLSDGNHGFRRSQRMEPVLLPEMVIQGDGYNGIAAVSKSSGDVKWRFAVRDGVEGGADVAGDRVFFGGNDGNFYSLDVQTGRLIWKYPVPAQVLAKPLVHKGVVYFLSGNNTLYALSAETGESKWQYKRAQTTNLSIRGGSTPVISDYILYVGMSDGFFVAVDKNDGRLLWERQLLEQGRFIDVDATPVLADGKIYVASYDGALFCLSQKDGQVLWRVDQGGATAVTLFERTIYYSTSMGEVMALDADSGQVQWTYQVKNGMATQPKIFRGLLVFGESHGPLRFLSARNGEPVGLFHSGRGVSAAPNVAENGDVFVMSNQGYLYSLHIGWGIGVH